MLVSLFSAKGSPGASSCALALASVWPRDVVVVEADPSGSDAIYRCRSSAGAALSPSPSILGLVSAARTETTTVVGDWTQQLGCGVRVVPGVTGPSQARGMAELWDHLISAVESSEVDVIADLGRLHRASPAMALAQRAKVRMPVLAASFDSVMHTRELLKDVSFDSNGRTVPMLVGPGRTMGADCRDVDEVLAEAGLIVAPVSPLPLDHPGLSALQGGVVLSRRLRASHLVRSARSAVESLLSETGVEVS